MSMLTPQQVATAAYSAGFRGDGLVWAVAVAEAESGGNTTARNTNRDGSVDRGLWQFNSRWHPEVSDAQADDPNSAAAAAYRVSAGGRSWSQWATYPAAATSHLGEAKMAAAAVGSAAPSTGTTATPASSILDPFGLADSVGGTIDGMATLGKSMAGIASMAVAAATWVSNSHNWVRVVEVLGGIAALIGGAYLLSTTGAGPVADGANAVVQTTKNVVKTAAEGVKTASAAAKA